jgi:hypothetical protein
VGTGSAPIGWRLFGCTSPAGTRRTRTRPP